MIPQPAEAEMERQHVLDRDRPLGRDRVIEAGLQGAQDPRCGEFGQPSLHRIVEGHGPVLDEQHRRHAGDRLGDRRDAEDGVTPDGFGITEGLVPDRRDVYVATPGHESNQPGQVASLDVALQRGIQRVDAFLRKPSRHASPLLDRLIGPRRWT